MDYICVYMYTHTLTRILMHTHTENKQDESVNFYFFEKLSESGFLLAVTASNFLYSFANTVFNKH